jgi:hypothetical protein
MADKIPVKAIYTGSDVTSLGELTSSDTINGSYITYGSSTSGQLLTSTGTGSTPTWQAAPQGVSNSKLFYFGSFN